MCCNWHHKWQHVHQSVFGGCQIGTQTVWSTMPACAGEEVTISYQGNQLQAHVQERQKATQNWGFHCKCARCQAEMSIPSGVNKALQTIRANLSSSPCAPGSVLASFRCRTVLCTHLHSYIGGVRCTSKTTVKHMLRRLSKSQLQRQPVPWQCTEFTLKNCLHMQAHVAMSVHPISTCHSDACSWTR